MSNSAVRLVSREEAVRLLNAAIGDKPGAVMDFARTHDIPDSTVSANRLGERTPGDRVCSILGIKIVTPFLREAEAWSAKNEAMIAESAAQGVRHVYLGSGQHSRIDSCDYDRVSAFHWWATPFRKNHSRIYAVRQSMRQSIFMHRFIVDADACLVVDHINGDCLDNRRRNLRVCTSGQNLFNRGPTARNTTGYKGVSQAQDGRWYAQICADKKRQFLGYFGSAEAAALAYDSAARSLHADFAKLNFPSGSAAT